MMNTDALEVAREVFKTEAKAVENLANLLTEDFRKSVQLVLKSKGRFVISGIGKSGHIGVKIAATLASTGTPSFFMHPAEAISLNSIQVTNLTKLSTKETSE